jgi:tetratricopeptide (TPR) repeat protein
MELTPFSRIKWERAMDLRKEGEYHEAERELAEALDQQPENLLLRSSLAEVYLRQERTLEAKMLADAILSEDPRYPKALYILGEVFLRQERPDEALQCFRQASEGDKRPYLLLRVAKTLREMGRYEEALETLDSVLLHQKDNPYFLKEKALVLNRLKQYDEALKAYERVRKLDPKDSFVRKEVVRLKGRQRLDKATIEELEKVVKLPSGKNDAQLRGLLGKKLKDAGRLQEAAAQFQIAGRLDPDNPFFLKQEGFCHYQLGEYDKAIECLGQALRKDPNDFYVKVTLKKIYSAAGNIRGLMELLEAVLKDHPQNVKLLGTLKGLKKKMGKEEQRKSLSNGESC